MASAASQRSAKVSRKTKETAISVAVDIDGTGRFDIATGVGFFDHMLEQLSRHSLIDMTVKAKGDLHIDDHHTVEDTGIALGQAHRQGARRAARHHALCVARPCHGRDADACGDRCVGPAVPGLERRLLVAEGRHLRYRTGARILPGADASMPASRCMSPTSTAPTTTTSPRPASRRWRACCAPRSSAIRARPTRYRRPRAR